MTTPSGAEAPVASAPAAPATVSERLRAATREIHAAAERRSFLAALLGGSLNLDAYARYLAQLARVYSALEARADRPDDPAPLGDRRLDRSATIDHDLAALGHPAWREEFPEHPATAAYADRIREVADAPEAARYLAHHYTRYLGDLSGGRIIAARVREHYGATDAELTFARFDGIGSPERYKRDYRTALDALDDRAAGALVDEAERAYALNIAIFDALDAESMR